MIKVLHVISAPAAGGAETYVRDLAKAQRLLGAEPHIAFLGSASELRRDPIFEVAYLAKLDEFCIPYFFIGNDSRCNILKGMWRVARYCKRNSITHYHAHLLFGLVFGAFLRIPRLFTEHNERVRGRRALRRFLNHFVDMNIAISKKCAIALERVVGRKVTIIFNGIDTSRMRVSVGLDQPSRPWRLLSVGRIGPQKNYKLLIEALERLKVLIADDFLVQVAGDGLPDAIAALEVQAAHAGIAHRVRFLGNQTDIANLMASSDLLVMSSAWEGFPIALLESAAAHLPFVATDVGGCGEIAELTGAGLVVPPGDANALARALQHLLSDHAKRNALRDAAGRNVSRFSIEHSAKAHLNLYKGTVRSGLFGRSFDI